MLFACYWWDLDRDQTWRMRYQRVMCTTTDGINKFGIALIVARTKHLRKISPYIHWQLTCTEHCRRHHFEHEQDIGLYTVQFITLQSKIYRAVKIFEAWYNTNCWFGWTHFAQISSLFMLSAFMANTAFPGWCGFGICCRNNVDQTDVTSPMLCDAWIVTWSVTVFPWRVHCLKFFQKSVSDRFLFEQSVDLYHFFIVAKVSELQQKHKPICRNCVVE